MRVPADNTSASAATPNEEDVDTVSRTVEVGKRQRAGGEEADFPVARPGREIRNGFVAIVDDCVVAGIGEFGGVSSIKENK